jgi:hypothetical protein
MLNLRLGIMSVAVSLVPIFANAVGPNVLTCSDGTKSVVINKSGDNYEILIAATDEKSAMTKSIGLVDLVQTADYPFNKSVKLDMGGLLSGIDLRLSFEEDVLKLKSSVANNGFGSGNNKAVNASLKCQVDSDFKTALKNTLSQKTKGAM